MGKYFGTDGVRGVANQELTPELAFKIGRCGGYVLTRHTDKRPKVVIGMDPRRSGTMLENALIAGLLSIGADVTRVGVITTPGVAYLTKFLKADAGVMISASHNPMEDNGIKFFGSDGFKLLDDVEAEIETLMDAENDELPRPIGKDLGTVTIQDKAASFYRAYLRNTINGEFSGLKIVLDCANGAASGIAPQLFRELGAEVIALHANPDGININANCGSTHPEIVQKAVAEHGADLGLSFDGDADRLIAVDENGELVDGDYILYICAKALKELGKLNNHTVVATVMSNLGFFVAMKEEGIQVIQTAVGDRYVMEAMREGKHVLGGEQSGHVIFLEHSTTGDGILTAIQLVNLLHHEHTPLSSLKTMMQKFPQKLKNIRVSDKNAWKDNEAIMAAIQDAEKALGDRGRVLVRPSGTESLVRVMVEAPTIEAVENYVQSISEVIERELSE